MSDPARTLDPRTPVIIGVGQLNQRVDQGAPPLEPTELAVEAVRRAADDAGAARGGDALLAGADEVAVVEIMSWRYRDPGRIVADAVGALSARSTYTESGGNYPQTLVNRAALAIQGGAADLVVLCGAEAWRTRSAARSSGGHPDWTLQADEISPDAMLGNDEPLGHPGEWARQLMMPIQIYPLFENALRATDGLTVDEHLDRISTLWSGFSEVAAGNEHAWIRRHYSPEEIRTPGPDNRMVGFPYTKLMNSNNAVEQGAAVIVASVERARELGVPTDRWVFPWAGTDAHDHWFVSNRWDLASSPAMRLAGRAALDLAGVGVDDLAHVDLYSCFPSAVQIAVRELGLSIDRPLTVTGGLSFAGGPWNNYVMHSIATMVERLRADADAIGLCTANGGFVTKHAFGVYSTRPPATPFRHQDLQAEVDALPRRALAEDHTGPVTVETSTVMYGRDGGPEQAWIAALLDDGRRAWGTSTDADLMKALVTEETAGRPANLAEDGTLTLV